MLLLFVLLFVLLQVFGACGDCGCLLLLIGVDCLLLIVVRCWLSVVRCCLLSVDGGRLVLLVVCCC